MKNYNEYKALIPNDAPPICEGAISELNYIASLCGQAKIEVTSVYDGSPVISLGDTELFLSTGLKSDYHPGGGFNMTSVGDNVFIYSTVESGIMNGIYRFCEEVFGYKFYAMDEIRVETKEIYPVPQFNISDQPTFMGRRLDSYALYHDNIYAARLRQNESVSRVTSEDPRYQGEGNLWSKLTDLSVSHQLVPMDIYQTEENIKKGWWAEKGNQLCWTKAYYDDELFSIMWGNLRQNIIDQPDKMFYMIGQEDNYHNCYCETCKRDYAKYGVGGVFLRMVNRLADEAKKFIDEHQGGREHYIVMFAYHQTEVPPVKVEGNKIVPIDETCIARDNVAIRIAPIRTGVLYSHIDPKINSAGTTAFVGWRVCCKKYTIWDYGSDFHAYIAPYPDLYVIGKNLRFYRDYGVVDVLTQVPAHTVGTEFNALKLFVRANLMWNVDQDENALINDFIDKYYGSAGPKIHEYLDLLYNHYKHLAKEHSYIADINKIVLTSAGYWPFSLLKKMQKIFDEAFALVAENESGERRALLEKRLRQESLFYRFMMFDAHKFQFTYEEQKENVETFERDAKEAGLIAWRNGWKVGVGHLDELIANHKDRLEIMRLAKEISSADNNPLVDYKYTKEWD